MATNKQGNQGGQGGGSERGFASMDPDKQREIASKGGEAVSQDRQHMAEIGREGGKASGGSKGSGGQQQQGGGESQRSEAGRKGGEASGGGKGGKK